MFWIKQKENNLPKGKADEAISGVLQHAFVSVICLFQLMGWHSISKVHHTFSTETYPSYNYVLIFAP